MSFSEHDQTISTIVGMGTFGMTLGAVAVRKILHPLRATAERNADVAEAVLGVPARVVNDWTVEPRRVGLIERVDMVGQHLTRQDELIHRLTNPRG
jgi:hypothetical protein